MKKDDGTAIHFFMAMDPPTITHQEKKVFVGKDGKPVFYEPMELKNARQKLTAFLRLHIPEAPFDGPLELHVKWCFQATGKHRPGEYRTTRPDTDNLQKMLKDCMTRLGYWPDDARVCCEIVEKFWSDLPGIYIDLRQL